jgi:arabinan endo-1,5-alpha-L-arabinosidase
VILAPDGKLWLSFGSYRGGIQLIPLIPPSAQNDTIGLPLKPKKHPKELTANGDAEASDIIFHNGWFYLFVNHGSCCRGANSTYHITVGRSHKINGTYKDRSGTSLLDGPGEPFLASDSELIGPGHFGLVPAQPGDPTERFSLHYEAGPASNGHPTLAIRTLTWSSDGWPLAGPLQPTAAAPPPAQSF